MKAFFKAWYEMFCAGWALIGLALCAVLTLVLLAFAVIGVTWLAKLIALSFIFVVLL